MKSFIEKHFDYEYNHRFNYNRHRGSLGQSSSYVPINKVKNWSWECFWLTQGVFAWLLFPLLGALIALPSGVSLYDVWASAGSGIWKAIGFGILWGIGGLTFGLSMRYLGIALGQSLALGTCSAFGTLIPAILAGQNLFSGDGLDPVKAKALVNEEKPVKDSMANLLEPVNLKTFVEKAIHPP